MTIRETCQSLASIFKIPTPNKADFVGQCFMKASESETCQMYAGAGSCLSELKADAGLQAVATGKGGTLPGAGAIVHPGGGHGGSGAVGNYMQIVGEIVTSDKPLNILQSKVGASIAAGNHTLATQLLQYFKKNVGEDGMFQKKSTPAQLTGFHSYLGTLSSGNAALNTAIAEAKKAIEDAGILSGSGSSRDSGAYFAGGVSGGTAFKSGYPFGSDLDEAYFGKLQLELGFRHKISTGSSFIYGLKAQLGTLLAANVENIDYDDGGRKSVTVTMPFFGVIAEAGWIWPLSKDMDISVFGFGGLGAYFMINNYQGLTASCDGEFCAADFANGAPLRWNAGVSLEFGYKQFFTFVRVEGEGFESDYQPQKLHMSDAMGMALFGVGYRGL